MATNPPHGASGGQSGASGWNPFGDVPPAVNDGEDEPQYAQVVNSEVDLRALAEARAMDEMHRNNMATPPSAWAQQLASVDDSSDDAVGDDGSGHYVVPGENDSLGYAVPVSGSGEYATINDGDLDFRDEHAYAELPSFPGPVVTPRGGQVSSTDPQQQHRVSLLSADSQHVESEEDWSDGDDDHGAGANSGDTMHVGTTSTIHYDDDNTDASYHGHVQSNTGAGSEDGELSVKLGDPAWCYTALYDYGSTQEEMSFVVGDIITVLRTDGGGDGWWYGCTSARCGWFPLTYVSHTPDRVHVGVHSARAGVTASAGTAGGLHQPQTRDGQSIHREKVSNQIDADYLLVDSVDDVASRGTAHEDDTRGVQDHPVYPPPPMPSVAKSKSGHAKAKSARSPPQSLSPLLSHRTPSHIDVRGSTSPPAAQSSPPLAQRGGRVKGSMKTKSVKRGSKGRAEPAQPRPALVISGPVAVTTGPSLERYKSLRGSSSSLSPSSTTPARADTASNWSGRSSVEGTAPPAMAVAAAQLSAGGGGDGAGLGSDDRGGGGGGGADGDPRQARTSMRSTRRATVGESAAVTSTHATRGISSSKSTSLDHAQLISALSSLRPTSPAGPGTMSVGMDVASRSHSLPPGASLDDGKRVGTTAKLKGPPPPVPTTATSGQNSMGVPLKGHRPPPPPPKQARTHSRSHSEDMLGSASVSSSSSSAAAAPPPKPQPQPRERVPPRPLGAKPASSPPSARQHPAGVSPSSPLLSPTSPRDVDPRTSASPPSGAGKSPRPKPRARAGTVASPTGQATPSGGGGGSLGSHLEGSHGNRPRAATSTTSSGGLVLPHGWEAAVDSSSGETYYFHTSGKTQWERPVE